MAAEILFRPTDVGNWLERLRFTRDDLIGVLRAMKGAVADCTDDDPPTARGYSAYKDGTRRLRQVGRRSGYRRDNTKGVASIINDELGIKIVTANTDDATGLRLWTANPKIAAKRGPLRARTSPLGKARLSNN